MSNPNDITDVFFDLDHTLWDFEKNSALSFELLLSQRYPQVDCQEFLAYYVPANLHFWRLYRQNKIAIEELRYQRLKHVFDSLKVPVSATEIHQLASDYLTVLPSFNHLFEGATEVLQYLSSRYRLHIITNGFTRVQERKLQNAGIDKYFDVVVDAESAGVKKPDPGIFNQALTLASATPSASLMVGDSLEADIYGALHVGMEVLFFSEQPIPAPSSIVQINRLEEMKNLL